MMASEQMEMCHIAVFSGIAIAVHNFPEGVASFVSTAADPSFCLSLALAIAMHNIPEGLAVAMPILKATGSRSKALFWAGMPGISEPLGGLAAWLVLREAMTPRTFAVLFGLVGGVMVHIALKKLLPMALKYDPENKYASNTFFAGMAVMGASLVAFKF